MTTQNRNKYRVQDVISAGPIDGLLTPNVPLHSVTFDGTPVAKQNGELNFKGAAITIRNGESVQDPVPGFEAIAITESVATELEDTTEWVTRQVGDGFSRVKVFLRYPNGLYRYTSKGKYASWDMQYDIAVSSDNSSWTTVVSVRGQGQTIAAFDRVHTIDNPTGDKSFYLRCRRARGPGNERETGTLYWHANVQLQNNPQSYPDTAYASIEFDAAQAGPVLPARGYRFKGIRCLVPTTYVPTQYDPTTGQITAHARYTSTVWDGSFKYDHCNDPAWIAYNLLVNETWGAGRTVNTDNIDIYSFFNASRYNVELIDDTINPLHPRFVWNGRIAEVKDMQAACDEVLAVCQASSYEEHGVIKVYQDRPTAPSKLLIRSNVVDGEMNFSSSKLEGRTTAVEITFNDRTEKFEPTTEIVLADESLIEAYGYRVVNIMQNGVVDRPQAIRAARAQIENSIVASVSGAMSVGWENWDLDVGDVVYVVDESIYVNAIQNRIDSIDGATVKIRNPLPRTFTNERCLIQTTVGLVETTATGLQGQTSFTIAAAQPNVQAFDAFVITQDTLPQYRVTAWKMKEDQKDLVMSYHDPSKYGRIERGEDYTPIYPPIDAEDILAPTQLRALGNIAGGIAAVYISWVPPVDPTNPSVSDTRVANYILEYEGPTGRGEVTIQDNAYTIEPADLGRYTFTLTAYTVKGTPSPSTTATLDFVIDGSSELLPPATITGDFTTKDLHLEWFENVNNAKNPRYAPQAYVVSFGDNAVTPSSSVTIPFVDGTVNYRHTYNYDDNVADFGTPSRVIYATIRVQDNMGLLSSPVTVSFANDAPATVAQKLIKGFDGVWVEITSGQEPDIAGYVIEIDGVVIDNKNSPNYVHQMAPGSSSSFRSAAYDTFGKTSLNWSLPEVAGPVDIEFPPPPVLPDTNRREFVFDSLKFTWLNESGVATNILSWTESSVTRTLITRDPNDGSENIGSEKKTLSAGSVAYSATNQYVVYDWTLNTIVLKTFDTWYGDEIHLHGTYSNGLFIPRYAGDTVTADKIAANAISTNHLQADAVDSRVLRAKEKFVVGDDVAGTNLIVLDGTAVYTPGADPQPAIMWVGNPNDPNGALFSVDVEGVSTMKDANVQGRVSSSEIVGGQINSSKLISSEITANTVTGSTFYGNTFSTAGGTLNDSGFYGSYIEGAYIYGSRITATDLDYDTGLLYPDGKPIVAGASYLHLPSASNSSDKPGVYYTDPVTQVVRFARSTFGYAGNPATPDMLRRYLRTNLGHPTQIFEIVGSTGHGERSNDPGGNGPSYWALEVNVNDGTGWESSQEFLCGNYRYATVLTADSRARDFSGVVTLKGLTFNISCVNGSLSITIQNLSTIDPPGLISIRGRIRVTVDLGQSVETVRCYNSLTMRQRADNQNAPPSLLIDGIDINEETGRPIYKTQESFMITEKYNPDGSSDGLFYKGRRINESMFFAD